MAQLSIEVQDYQSTISITFTYLKTEESTEMMCGQHT